MKNFVKPFALVLTLLIFGGLVPRVSAQSTCPGGASLSGWYGMLVGSYSGTGGKYLVGALNFDGACGITGTNTYGGNDGNIAQASVTGSYGANADGTMGITLNLAGQTTPQTYIVGVSQSGNEAVGIETDGTSGIIDLQAQLISPSGGYSNASLNGTYAIACIGGGVDLNFQSFDGNGNITGVDSEQNNGGVTTNTPYTGTYTVNSDGTFLGNVIFNGFPVPFYGVVDNGNNEVEFIYKDYNSCSGKKSTSTTLSGTYGLLASGTSVTGGGEQFLSGVLNLNSGSLTGEVNGGVNGVYSNSPVTGSYTVLSNNTVWISMNLVSQGITETYNVGVSEAGYEADGIETDNLATATVDLQSQVLSNGQTYSDSNLNGSYASVCSNIGLYALNYVTFNGAGSLSGSLAFSDGGTYYGDNAITGSYSVNADGTFSGSLTGGFAQYSFTGAIENDGAEIAYTYETGGTGNMACSGVSTYGPVGTAPLAATPTLSLAPGAYIGAQSVTLSDTTPGAVIYFTTNGTPPTPNSPNYAGTPLSLSTTATTEIEAIAVAAGYNNSAILSGTYSIRIPLSQTISFPSIPTQNGPGTITLAATASSGLPVSYSVSSGWATVNGNVLTTTGAGSVTVTASQGGNVYYSAAPPVSQNFTVNPNAGQLNGQNCNGEYTGKYKNNLTVSSGQTCIFTNGGITGTLTLNGGTVLLENNSFVRGSLHVSSGTVTIMNSTLGHNLQVTNGGSFAISGTTIAGNVVVLNLPAGPGTNTICGSSVTGNVQVQNSGTAVQLGATGCAGNVVGGDIEVHKNSAATTIDYNTVNGSLIDQTNTAPTQVFTNAVSMNLQCQWNRSITGGGNTASSKQGQCTRF
jgi:hypothetical protein